MSAAPPVPPHDLVAESSHASWRPMAIAWLVLILAPTAILAPCLFGDRFYVPYDLAEFPPKAMELEPQELDRLERAPRNPDITEIPVIVLPEIEFARQEVAAGRLPVWNPHVRFGAPLFANGLGGWVYPPNLMLWLADDPRTALAWKAWFALALAGLFTLHWLRGHRVGWLAATFGALVFELGGTVTANAHFYMRLDTLAWWPALLLGGLAVVRARSPARRWWSSLGLGAAIGMMLLAGFPPYVLVGALGAGAYWVLLWVAGPVGGTRLRSLLALLGAGLLGIALAAVWLVPAIAYFPESSRALSPPTDEVRAQGYASFGLFGYLLPTFVGVPGSEPSYDHSPIYWLLHDLYDASGAPRIERNFSYTEYTVFVGTLAFLLAVQAVVSGRRLVLGLIGIASAAFFVGHAPRILEPLYSVPILASVPPMRFVAWLAPCMAALAALGFDSWSRGGRLRSGALAGSAALAATVAGWLAFQGPLSDPAAVAEALVERYRSSTGVDAEGALGILGGGDPAVGARRVVMGGDRLAANLWRAAAMLGVAALLFGLAAWRPRWRRGLGIVIIGVTVIELIALAVPINSGRELLHDASDTPVHRMLAERHRARRERGGVRVARAAAGPKWPVDLPAGTLIADRIGDLNAYAFVDRWSSPLFVGLWGPGQMARKLWPVALPDDERLRHPILDLFAVDTLLATRPIANAGHPIEEFRLRDDRADSTFYVYDRPSALPRAFVVPEVKVVADDAAVVEALVDSAFDPRRVAWLTPDQARRLGAPAIASGESGGRDVRFIDERPDALRLEVGGGAAGYLVLSDAALGGWAAFVDGEPTPIARGNAFCRVIAVPSGGCRVEFRYRAPGLLAGFIVSAFALLLLIVAAVAVGITAARPR